MKTFVLAIGGTGARVLRSLTMLLAAGAGENKPAQGNSYPVNEIVPMIIDYDIENADTCRTQRLLENYALIHNMAYCLVTQRDEEGVHLVETPAHDLRNLFFGTRLGEIRNPRHKTSYNVHLDAVDAHKTFGQHIGYNALNAVNGTEATRYLINSLYDTSPESSNLAEVNLNLRVGFKGCPNIGSVVMRDLKDSYEIQQLIRNAPGCRVVIVGSVFGGTGASGIPVLLNAIKKADANINVSIVAVEPYFEVENDTKSAISSSTFLSKTKAAFDAYSQGGSQSVNSKANSIYYIGDCHINSAFHNSEGGASQKNDANITELAAAMAILDISREDNPLLPKFKCLRMENGAGFSVDATGQEMSQPFSYESFPNGDGSLLRQNYIDPLCRLAILTTYCDTFLKHPEDWKKNNVWLAEAASNFGNEKEFMNYLFAFLEEFKAWINEMGTEMHALDLFNFTDGYHLLFQGPLPNTRKGGFFGGSSDIIDNNSDFSINAVLNKYYVKNKGDQSLKDQNKLLFFKHADSATREMFQRVLNEYISQKTKASK